MSTEAPKITCYLKTFCGWSEGVRAIMRQYNLEFEEKDIIANPALRWEMEQKSGSLSPLAWRSMAPCSLTSAVRKSRLG
jgi:hypothetical protein